MRTQTIENQVQMPAIGLGTWKSEPGEVYDAVRVALAAGYRHIDCAAIYGNEAEVGRALEDGMREENIPREAVWVTSKLWNDAHHPDDVRPAAERTLKDLRLDYLDLYLMHWPIAHRRRVTMPRGPEDLVPLAELPLEVTLEAMRGLEGAGMVRHVGVSNFSLSRVRHVTDATGKAPAVNQVELHPYFPQPALLDGCAELGVAVTAYSPLGTPDSARMLGRTDEQPLLEHPAVAAVAARHDANPGQVLIAWALARGTSVIPKSTHPDRIRTNLAAAEIALTAADLEQLSGLEKGRLVDGSLFTLGAGYTLASLWDEAA